MFDDGNTSSIQNPTNTFANPGTYTVVLTATNAGGSDDTTKTDYITVNANTAITTQPSNTTACVGDDVTFTVTAAGSNLSYQWKKGTTNVGTDNASYSITGVVTGDAADYTCVVSGDCGNVTSSMATLVVNPLPVAASSASATSTLICNGESTDLTYSGGSGTTFNWFTTSCGGSLAGTGNNLTVSPTTNTTYYGRWENSCGNSTCQTVTIIVDDMPSLTMSATNATCGDSDGTATVVATGGTGTYSYLWDDASTQDTPTATGLAQGTYNVEVTSGACMATDLVNVNEDGAPTVTVSATLTELCEGETSVLTATGADSYVWTPTTGLDATTGAIVNATPVSDITYTVTGTTAGCSASDNVSITVNHTPTVGFTVDNSLEPIIDFTNTTTGADSYSWDLGDGTTGVTTTDVTHEYTANNTYTVVLSATNGCGTVTYQQDVTITNVSIASIDKASIKVYPNPANDYVIINTGDYSQMTGYNLQIVNTLGQTVFENLIDHAEFQIDVNDFGGYGTYFIKIFDDQGTLLDTRKLILQ
ncbi:MAG: PKD domain-containing protein [Bacteroidota bacterium]|nr:PKD domain-containing protein [Bacteroidota bacterium]